MYVCMYTVRIYLQQCTKPHTADTHNALRSVNAPNHSHIAEQLV